MTGYRWLRDSAPRRLGVGLIALLVAVWVELASPTVAASPNAAAPFNQPSFYPLSQTLPADQYRPVADWLGRLILPDLPTAEASSVEPDWVEFEVYQAPASYQSLVGQRLKLTWQTELLPQVARLTRSVAFTPEVEASLAKGNLHPTRLNGHRVGPLQSLAGARPQDDVIVSLAQVAVEAAGSTAPVLRISQPPIQRTGRYYTLVQIRETPADAADALPTACPGAPPCPSELFRVQHYNRKTRQFDGPTETVRIPQQPRSQIGLFNSTPRNLVQSEAGREGWYLFGAEDEAGLFTVQALQPRSLVQLRPQQVISGNRAIGHYIHQDNWADTKQRKGSLQTALLAPSASGNPDLSQWQEGQQFLLMHLFGGRGGLRGEPPLVGTVPGHFAYGVAQIIREPLADELQFDLTYEQVYGSNIEGIISGSQSWATFMGSLQSGWLATRPVSDVLINLDILQDYRFGEVTLSPLQTLLRELQIITARYRVGDGTGGALVTPATSCVQDSNQALFITIQRLQEQVSQSPPIQTWPADHADSPDARRFQDLVALGQELERTLMPLGIVREDWQQNARVLTGTGQFAHTASGPRNILAGLTSWRTALPRGTQDDLSLVFLRHQAQLWFLRTNQVGGQDPDIFPIAPTRQFGVWTVGNLPLLSLLLERTLGSIRLLSGQDWRIMGIALLTYAAVALPLGLGSGFLKLPVRSRQPTGTANPSAQTRPILLHLGLALRLLLFPALGEELLFRVLLLAYPGTSLNPAVWWAWASFSLALFVVYHPLNARFLYRAGFPTFFDPNFLVLTTLLGLTCTVAYYLTQSWLVIGLIHWIVVLVWIFLLGGAARLGRQG
ncbi:MAG: type II CAAX prenyl endopeptidase Rce1 family protein [Elainella sp.]